MNAKNKKEQELEDGATNLDYWWSAWGSDISISLIEKDPQLACKSIDKQAEIGGGDSNMHGGDTQSMHTQTHINRCLLVNKLSYLLKLFTWCLQDSFHFAFGKG